MLRFAILELLHHRPLSGYELNRRFSGSIGFFWRANHSQIYPELKRMEKEGMVAGQRIAQELRPTKTVYAITPEGKRALVEWLREKSFLPAVKDEMLLKVFAFNLVPGEEAEAQLRHYEQLHQERLEFFLETKRKLEERHGGLDGTADPIVFWNSLCLRQQIASERTYIAWCRWALGAHREFLSQRGNDDVHGELPGEDSGRSSGPV